jgi:hypothetical protein
MMPRSMQSMRQELQRHTQASIDARHVEMKLQLPADISFPPESQAT